MKSSSMSGDPATLFFNNRYLLFLTIIVTLVAGYSALVGLPRLEDPTIANRNPIVITPFPGATPDRVEALISEPIEEELEEISTIKIVESTSRAGISIVSIELKDNVEKKDLDPIFSEMRDKLSVAAASFPEGAGFPFLDEERPPVAYTRIVALQFADGIDHQDKIGILARKAELLSDTLLQITGTELVRIFGQPEEEISVDLDRDGLAERGLSPLDVVTALQNADVKVPAGQLRNQTSNLLVEVRGSFTSLDRIRKVIISSSDSGSKTVRVGDIATVRKAVRIPQEQVAFSKDKRQILVAARVAEDQRVDTWDNRAQEVIDQFNANQGGGIETVDVFRQNEYTQSRLNDLVSNLILGVIVVLAVIFFTMGWKRALIVGSAIPMTAGATLFVISLQGGKLHQMSIFGMILGLGVLIDSAIVVTDEVRKNLAKGLSRREAISATVRILFIPLLSSTLTSILAFLPILLLPGSAGDFVGSISGSVIIALSLSFFFSMTVIVSLAGLLSNKEEKKKPKFLPLFVREGLQLPWLTKIMRHLIKLSVRRPIFGIGISLVVPVIGFALAPTLGSQFFPRTDRNMFIVEMTFPTSTAISSTTKSARRADEILRQQEGFQEVHWLAGSSFPPVYYNLLQTQDNSPFYVSGVVRVDSFKTTSRLVPDLQEKLENLFPDARVRVSKFAQGPPAVADVVIRLSGPSISTLQELGDSVQRRLAEHPDIINTEQTLTRGEPKLWFELDEENARAANFEPAEISNQLLVNTDGMIGGSILEGTEELPVRVRLPVTQRSTLGGLSDLQFVNRTGASVPLRALGEFNLQPDIGAITRRNGERVNSIRGYARTGSLPIQITNDVQELLESSGFQIPQGYTLTLGGEAENQSEAVGNLFLYLPIIGVVTIAILILSFKSIRVAVILLLTAPLAAGFGLFATWTMGFPVSFNTILGSIGLIGLAFNDNIVTLAAIFSSKEARLGNIEAITEEVLGCGRHLVSTTLTTIGSFLPLLILIGGQFWPPLAIVLAGGVGGATLLAAIFTPAMFRLLFHFRNKTV